MLLGLGRKIKVKDKIYLKPNSIDLKVSSLILRTLNLHTRNLLNSITNKIIFFVLALLFFFSSDKLFFLKCLFFSIILWNINEFLKGIFIKERPYSLLGVPLSTSTEWNKSFPSGHSSFSMFWLLAFSNLKISYLLVLVPILRLITLQHWISDIIFGCLEGILYYFIIAALFL